MTGEVLDLLGLICSCVGLSLKGSKIWQGRGPGRSTVNAAAHNASGRHRGRKAHFMLTTKACYIFSLDIYLGAFGPAHLTGL